MPSLLRRALTVGLVFALAACAPPATEDGDLALAGLRGPTSMAMMGLVHGDDADYPLTVYGTADEVVPLLAQGEVDVAVIPANLAAVLYQRTAGTEDQIVALAITTLGVLSILETGDSISSMDDLRGRTIYTTGKGTTPEHVLTYLLTAHGLVAGDDVHVEFRTEATEVAALLAEDPTAVGLLPQPYVTTVVAAQPQLRVALDLTEQWDAVTPDSTLVTAVAVTRAHVVEEQPERIAAFLRDLDASVTWVNSHPEDAASLMVDYGIVPSAEVGAASLPASHVVSITGSHMEALLRGYLAVLYAADPAAVGGALPDDDFYYRD